MVHKPEKDQEGQLTNQYFEPHKDIGVERPNFFDLNKKGDGASLEGQEKSLLPKGPTMNKYLEEARSALDRPSRVGGQPKPEQVLEGMYKAITAMLKYLEELDQRTK
jgi:hypothetical protein